MRTGHLPWLVLVALALGVVGAVRGQRVTLAWDASPSVGVVDYRIHFGTNTGQYAFVTNAGLTLTQTVVLPHPGRWFFAATAVAANGLESDFSNEVEWEAKPVPPVMNGEAWVRLLPVIERSTNGMDWLSITGAPTFLAATNVAEVFQTRRLVIERVQRVVEP
jgi:hypothetical protein